MTREQMIVYMNLLDESFIVEASPANTHKFIVHKKSKYISSQLLRHRLF